MDTGARVEPATFLRRAEAYGIDSAAVGGLWFAAMVIAVGIEDALGWEDAEGEAGALFTVVFLALPVFWFAYQWVCNALGISPGKGMMSLRTVAPAIGWPRSDGAPHSRPRAIRGLLRTTGQALGSLALGVGFWWALWDPQNRALHDKLAGTWVVRSGIEGLALPGAAALPQLAEAATPRISAPRRLRFRYAGRAGDDEYVELGRTVVRIEGAEGRSDVPYGMIRSLTLGNDGAVRLSFDEDIFGKRVESARSFPAPEDLEAFIGELELRVQAAQGHPLPVVR